MDLKQNIEALLPELVGLRHELHRCPELGYQEEQTSRRIEQELRRIDGLDIRTQVAGTGIVATLHGSAGGKGPERCVALRADMDALPVQEANTFDYRSQVDGRMHACGHDGHMTCLVGAARMLGQLRDRFRGTVRFVFQPAEEAGAGGRKIVEEGALDDPPAGAAFAMHGWPECKLGHVMVGSGPILAAATSWTMTINGRGAHAAYPHQGQDVIVTAAHLVSRMQTLISRTRDPVRPGALSVCAIQAGHAHNVLPGQCVLKGTIRGLDQATHDMIVDGLERLARTEAEFSGTSIDLALGQSYPSLVNNCDAAALVRGVANEVCGEDRVDMAPVPSLGGEDFAFFANRVPSAMWRIGLCPPDRASYPKLHQPDFDFTDAAIPIAVRIHTQVALKFLETGFADA